MPTKQNLSLTDAAAASNRSYWVLREAILRGELRATQFKKGGKYYVRPQDLEDYFNANLVSPLSGKVA